jgi:hypothetical protein
MRVMICHDRPIGLCCDDQAEQVTTNRHEDIRFTLSNATTWVAFASSERGILAAAEAAFTAETPCSEARAAPRDRMVGSFFAMPLLPKIRFNSNFACKDTTNSLTRPGQARGIAISWTRQPTLVRSQAASPKLGVGSQSQRHSLPTQTLPEVGHRQNSDGPQ